jgi:hypothetical protein
MASGNPSLCSLRVAVIFAALFALCGVVRADPDYKELKAEIKKLEQSVDAARKERNDADSKLTDNRAAQKNANGQQLAALKKAAIDLAAKAGEKADALAAAQQNLAEKQGELRETAAAHAINQISDAATIEKRVGEAQSAIEDWRAALGSLPEVPDLRPLDGIEPDDQPAVRKQDKKTLEAFEKWATGEESRVIKEQRQAKDLVDAEPKWKTSNDGGKELLAAARGLTETLEQRKKDLAELRKTAKARLKQIK